ncbi:transposase, partial [Clostridioides difficile]
GNNSKIPLENRTKNLQVSKLFHEKRKENLKRIISQEGCQLRMNRIIQAEGTFAQVKQNMKFRRFLS